MCRIFLFRQSIPTDRKTRETIYENNEPSCAHCIHRPFNGGDAVVHRLRRTGRRGGVLRRLSDPAVRPIADCALVAPADSTPQGVWSIDENGELVQREGVQIKSANFTSIRQLIGEDSAYADAFAGGTLTHTFLDVNDYHRYHFPIDGTVVEVRKIPGTNAAGGVTVWDADTGRYVLEDTIPGWQMIETRDCVILDTEYGLVAILPIGMSQICSCNWEESVQVGAEVKRGAPMGYFLFGGSDIVMVFQRQVEFDLLVPEDGAGGLQHRLMGEAYAELSLM